MFLPSLSNLPYSTACSAVGGYIFGKIAGSSGWQYAKIAAITTLTHDIFFLIGARSQKIKEMNHSLFIMSSAAANSLHICALKYLDLISNKGAIILFALTTLSLFNRVEELEKKHSSLYPSKYDQFGYK